MSQIIAPVIKTGTAPTVEIMVPPAKYIAPVNNVLRIILDVTILYAVLPTIDDISELSVIYGKQKND